MKKVLVISAIALRSGGTLSVLQDCLRELSGDRYASWEIIALVKDRSLIDPGIRNIRFIEFNGAGFYLRRLYYEFYHFARLSRELNAQVWLSLHDISPRVSAARQAVYCHNPSPFYRFRLKDLWLDPTFGFFTLFYKYLYRLNIHANDFVIVQQNWLREKFSRLYDLDPSKIIVAHPRVDYNFAPHQESSRGHVFIYPCFPRVFKNIEVIGDAASKLEAQGIDNFEIVLTIEGNENRYARLLKKKYGHLKTLRFTGSQPRENIFKAYQSAQALLFPSLLETWGLPISEFKQTGKLILLADLPYAHETLGEYQNAVFFDPRNANDLAEKMARAVTNALQPGAIEAVKVASPMSADWEQLFNILLKTDLMREKEQHPK
jgi:glycosyltransferase involved in cell wall biosynthesis